MTRISELLAAWSLYPALPWLFVLFFAGLFTFLVMLILRPSLFQRTVCELREDARVHFTDPPTQRGRR